MPGPIPGTYGRNERLQRELGVNYRELCALVAAVSSFLIDGGPVTRVWVDKMVHRADDGNPRYAGEELVNLARRGLLVEVARIENECFYRPTPRAVDKVRGWAGYHAIAASEAAE